MDTLNPKGSIRSLNDKQTNIVKLIVEQEERTTTLEDRIKIQDNRITELLSKIDNLTKELSIAKDQHTELSKFVGLE